MFHIPLDKLNFNDDCQYDITGSLVCKKGVVFQEHVGIESCVSNLGQQCSPYIKGGCCKSVCMPVRDTVKNSIDWNTFVCQEAQVWQEQK